MPDSAPTQARELAAGTLIGGHYRVQTCLGRGGMGEVYRVTDERTGQRLALKRRALAEHGDYASLAFQFEREYHTLCELAHPRIIEVYDFGVSPVGAYYTMELLDGQDLRERGRLPWRAASALLVDVASSLAIIHSRGFLHRDLSPRNVRCTADGRAKLIDFGALMPIGPMKNLVGTPPFIPPEALQLQALDARADLFALGALAYSMLTGSHAYPARSIRELRDVWSRPPARIAQLQPDVPDALDRLVLGLLHLNRGARPATAAEVMERLAGVAGLELEERIEVTRAYLVTPPLIGRGAQLDRVRTQLVQARERAACVMIEGAPGTGRSRFLDACVLEAKLLGATVLRADAAEGASGEYGAVRVLCTQLLADLPELAQQSAGLRRNVLAFLVRELDPETLPLKAAAEPAQLQSALRDWFLTVARSRQLVIAIDDADGLDAASASWLATLALRSGRRGLSLLFATGGNLEPTSALAVIQTVADTVTLQPFAPEQTEALIRGVFGLQQVAAVAERVHHLADGKPRETMALVEWLVERGTARYEAGSWTLPVELHAHELPVSLTAACAARLAALTPDARELGEVLSLTDVTILHVEDYAKLTPHGQLARVHRALDGLLSAGVLVTAGEYYRFRQPEFPALLSSSLSDEQRRSLHARIARVLEQYGRPILSAHHMLLAGEEQRAIDCLLPLTLDPRIEISSRSLSTAQRGLEAAERLQLPPRILIHFQFWLASFAAILGDYTLYMRYAVPLIEQFKGASGLDDYNALDPARPAGERLMEALAGVQQRFDQTPEAQRGFSPVESIRFLAVSCSGCVNMASIAQSLELIERLPSLEPLVPLSPALGVAQSLIDGMRAFQSGRYEDARLTYLRVLDRVQQPDKGGLDPVVFTAVRLGMMYFQAVISTIRGIPSAPEWLVELEQEPGHRVNAWRVHMASELMQGNYAAAALCQRRSELAQVQDGQQLRYRGTTVRLELLGYARANDLLGVKRTMERIEPVAQRHPRWQVDLCLARYHYKRLQGDDNGALEELLPALALVAPGRHINWAITAATHVRALCAVGRQDEAVGYGFEYLAEHDRASLSGMSSELTQALAEALLKVGRLDEAAHYADRCIGEAEALGARGVFLGARYETRARVALAMNDLDAFRDMAAGCEREYKPGTNPALTAQYERLLRDAESSDDDAGTLAADGGEINSSTLGRARTLTARLQACNDAQECARVALGLLFELTGADAGYLFGMRQGELQLLASAGMRGSPPAPLLDALQAYLGRRLHAEFETESTNTADSPQPHVWIDAEGRRVSPCLIVGERDDERAVAGLAALHLSDARRVVANELLNAIAAAMLDQHDMDVLTVVASS